MFPLALAQTTGSPARWTWGNDPMADYLIRDAFRLFYADFRSRHTVTPEQESAAWCIMQCKTGLLGFTENVCPQCGYRKIHYASCGNRSCPSCQGTKPEEWVQARSSELIEGLPYFHVIMTVPHELNPLFLSTPRELYRLLMQSTADAVKAVASRKEHLGCAPGIVSVLHSWGQKLDLHPHVHMLVSGGGLENTLKFVRVRNGHFFCPEGKLGGAFREAFLRGLKDLRASGRLVFEGSAASYRNHYTWEELLTKLYHTSWNAFVKETFNGNGNAIQYLSRYAYRTAVSNSRILSVTAEGVTISYKDYKDGGKTKPMLLSGEEFIRRFLLHILPKGFNRIRYSGYLANACRKKNLKIIHKLTAAAERTNRLAGMKTRERIKAIFGIDICICPVCSGEMHMIRRMEPKRLC